MISQWLFIHAFHFSHQGGVFAGATYIEAAGSAGFDHGVGSLSNGDTTRLGGFPEDKNGWFT